MDDREHTGMSDEALDRELEAALRVDPSPEFRAKVRARVADERIAGGWLTPAGWRLALAACGIGLLALSGVWLLQDPAPLVPEHVRAVPRDVPAETARASTEAGDSAPERHDAVAPPAAAARRTIAAPRVAARTEAAARRDSATRQDAETSRFEVLISPAEAAALRQLFAAAGNRQLDASAWPDLEAAAGPPAPIEEIVLEPIVVTPLAVVESE